MPAVFLLRSITPRASDPRGRARRALTTVHGPPVSRGVTRPEFALLMQPLAGMVVQTRVVGTTATAHGAERDSKRTGNVPPVCCFTHGILTPLTVKRLGAVLTNDR